MYPRILDIQRLIRHKSLFLFGSRQTGKSTLLRHLFPDARWFDLLESDTFRELSARPELLRQTLSPEDRLVVIDEVQKLPNLLDEVHLLIERNKDLRFILTGSSARKLRRGSANLLAGRAWICRLHPLVSAEVGHSRLLDRLNRGSLPSVLDSELYRQDLRTYVGAYLQEEIRAEGLSRSVENFSRFLEVAGLSNGEQLNYTAIASDTGVSAKVVREYYQILEDTLVGHLLPVYRKTVKRKPASKAKFYFFDVGVANTLMRRADIVPGSELFGKVLEHLVFLELRAYLDYCQLDYPLTYWRSRSGYEVDFLIGDKVAVEVKSKTRVINRDYKSIMALDDEVGFERKIVVAMEQQVRRLDNRIEIFPVEQFLKTLWEGGIVR